MLTLTSKGNWIARLLKPIKNTIEANEQRLQFKQAMSTLSVLKETYLHHPTYKEPEDYIRAVTFFMGIVRKDFVTSVNASELFYGIKKYEESVFYFPFRVIQEEHSASKIFENGIEVPLTTDTISIPWHIERLYNISRHLQSTVFKYDPSNHFSFYLKEFDLLIVWNGRHSLFHGSHTRQSSMIQTQVISLSDMFDLVDTDGAFWFSKDPAESNKDRVPVNDVRAAILFAYAKEIHHYKQTKQPAN